MDFGSKNSELCLGFSANAHAESAPHPFPFSEKIQCKRSGIRVQDFRFQHFTNGKFMVQAIGPGKYFTLQKTYRLRKIRVASLIKGKVKIFEFIGIAARPAPKAGKQPGLTFCQKRNTTFSGCFYQFERIIGLVKRQGNSFASHGCLHHP